MSFAVDPLSGMEGLYREIEADEAAEKQAAADEERRWHSFWLARAKLNDGWPGSEGGN